MDEQDKKTWKYLTYFGILIAIVVILQMILAYYLQKIEPTLGSIEHA